MSFVFVMSAQSFADTGQPIEVTVCFPASTTAAECPTVTFADLEAAEPSNCGYNEGNGISEGELSGDECCYVAYQAWDCYSHDSGTNEPEPDPPVDSDSGTDSGSSDPGSGCGCSQQGDGAAVSAAGLVMVWSRRRTAGTGVRR